MVPIHEEAFMKYLAPLLTLKPKEVKTKIF
jgi:hypothetical protein